MVGSIMQPLCICVPLTDFVQLMECCGYSLCAWLRAVGLVPVYGTHTFYIVAGHSNAIHAVGDMEAFCTLKAIFGRCDRALYCLIT